MKNLAGVDGLLADSQVIQELNAAGITPVRGVRHTGEVAASVTGKLGKFVFTRRWYFWAVEGKVPLSVALEMYANQAMERYIRADGFSSGVDPQERAVCGQITVYHIDTQEGLNFFVETLKNHGLV